MNVREKKTFLALIFLLLVFSGELRGEEGTGTVSRRDRLAYRSAHSKGHRTSYRSYEDYIPERRKRNNKKYKDTGKSRKRGHAVVKKTGRPAGNRNYEHYRVKRGDTLYRISRKFSVPVKEISKANGLKSRNSIRRGMVLKIPVCTKSRENRISEKTGNRKKDRRPGAPAFKWPLNRITNYSRDGKNGVKSIGILIKSRPGSKVVSSAGGIVKRIGKMRGYGTYVVVMHKNRYVTVYSKLGSVSVHEGKNIKKGDIIGYLDGNRTLHFQISQEGKSLNPLKYLNNRS